MSNQIPPSPPSVPKRAWYLRWWVWLIAVVVVAGGISAAVNPRGATDSTPGVAQTNQTVSPLPLVSATPAVVAPLDLAGFLTKKGVSFDAARVSGQKALIYVPTKTTDKEAEQVARDAMTYICDYAKEAGDDLPVANRVEVSDSVSPFSPGYDAADHPSGFATDSIC